MRAALVGYSSSEEEDEGEEGGCRGDGAQEPPRARCVRRDGGFARRWRNARPGFLLLVFFPRSPGRPRLPVPAGLPGDPDPEEAVSDDSSRHGGRIRGFPHERGSWATHVYLPCRYRRPGTAPGREGGTEPSRVRLVHGGTGGLGDPPVSGADPWPMLRGRDPVLTVLRRRYSAGGIPGAAGAAAVPRPHLRLLAGCHGAVSPQPLAVRGAAVPLDRPLCPLPQGASGHLPQVRTVGP